MSVRTSTERPEAVDFGSITIGNIDSEALLQATEIATKTTSKQAAEIPLEYQVENSSDRVIKIVQGYTPIINREVWKK